MAVLFFILKLLGWLLLAAVVLLVIALLLPLGITLRWTPAALTVQALYGPLRFKLYPRGASAPPKAAPAAKSTAPSPRPVEKTVQGASADVTVKVTPDAPPKQAAAKGESAPKSEPAAAPENSADSAEKDTSGGLPFNISAHIDAAMQLLADDPMAFAKCMLGHTGWLGRRLLRSLRVQHLTVFFAVTGTDAAATAQLYGAAQTLANNLLAFVQQYIRLQSDTLWLEPDFTGQRGSENEVSFHLSACTGVLIWLILRLLYRLYKDPQLQPAAKA